MKEKWRAAGWKDPDAPQAGFRVQDSVLKPEQMEAAFAVQHDQLQWRATHQAINEEIETCLQAAKDLTLNPQGCANEVAAIEHLQRVQLKLHELRERGLKVGG